MDTLPNLESAGIATVLAVIVYFALRQLASRLGDDVYNALKTLVLEQVRRVLHRPTAPVPASPAPQPLEPAAMPPLSQPPATPATTTPTITTAKARYAVLKRHGSGQLCELYQAQQCLLAPTDPTASLDSPVMVMLKIGREPESHERLLNEANTLRTLNAHAPHYAKHLPQLLDQFRMANQAPALVLPYWSDSYTIRQLRERFFPEGIEPRHIVWILRRSLSVLGYVHSQGILHGHITPDHLLIRPQDHNVWLLDWCYAITRPKETGQTFHTIEPPYSPPEAIEGKPPLPASDLYALGQVMIYALGGDPHRQTLPPQVPQRLARFVEFLVKSSAVQRPSDAWKLYRELDSLRNDLFGPHQFIEFMVKEL